jgi:hypothetical protein
MTVEFTPGRRLRRSPSHLSADYRYTTRSPLVIPAVWVTWSAKRRNRWPSANTRKPLRCLAWYHRVWNCERKSLRTGDAIAAVSSAAS